MKLTLIVAMSSNRVIGAGNRLPWHLPADLRRFKELTWGHCLLMGRKTCSSIGRALPGRMTLVLSRNPDFVPPAGVVLTPSLNAALALAERESGGREVFVAGGAEIYQQTLPFCWRIHRTLVELEVTGDAFFPELVESDWQMVSDEPGAAAGAAADTPPFRFQLLERRGAPATP